MQFSRFSCRALLAALISNRALILSCLALVITLLSTSAARAGSWKFTCSADSSGSLTRTPAGGGLPTVQSTWTAPGSQTGSFTLGPQFGGSTDYASSLVATITVTVTATWTHGTGQNDTNDPAPPNVWLCESARTNWTGSYQATGVCHNGLGSADIEPGGSGSSDSATAPVTVPPAYWKKYTVTGNAVTLLPRTLSAEADSSLPYGDDFQVDVDSYTITVHAQPYNWHITNVTRGPAPSHGIVAGEMEL